MTTNATPATPNAGSNGTPSEATAKAGDAAAAKATPEAKPAEGQKAANTEGKEGTGAKPQEGAGTPPPEDAFAALKLPDGVAPEAATEFKAMAKEIGLKGEAAQKLIDFNIKLNEREAARLAEQKAANLNEMKADKEFGGANFEATTSAILKTVQKFGGEEAVQLLQNSPLGDNPALFRLLAKFAKADAEDRAGPRDESGAKRAPTSQEAVNRRHFPSMFPPNP